MRIQNAIQNTTDQHPDLHQYVVHSLVPVFILRWLVLGPQRQKPPPTQLNCRLTSINPPHTELTASLSSLGKVCWLRLEDGIVRFTIIPDQGTQVWAQLPVVCSPLTHPPSQNKTKPNKKTKCCTGRHFRGINLHPRLQLRSHQPRGSHRRPAPRPPLRHRRVLRPNPAHEKGECPVARADYSLLFVDDGVKCHWRY